MINYCEHLIMSLKNVYEYICVELLVGSIINNNDI